MKAIGFKTSLPITDNNSLIAFETEKPTPTGHDLLVKIKAIAVNPVDYKIRTGSSKDTVMETPRILGWDAVGEVVSVGEKVTLFKVGDEVIYAGEITKPGTNAEYQLVDERITGKKPKKASLAEAAVLPLTALTAWEALFKRIKLQPGEGKGKSVLIIAGAGGVGSIAIQLAKKVAGLKVIATASRPESIEWCKQLGADHVVNHHNLVEEVKEIVTDVDYILDFADTYGHWDSMVELIKPQGHICTIVGSSGKPLQVDALQSKSVTLSYELMYTRSIYQTEDMIEQHHILNKIADLIDSGEIKSTLNTTLKGFTVENLKNAHKQLETGKTIGKIAIEF